MRSAGKIVLVVDDDEDVLGAVRDVLESARHECWAARSANEALVRIAHEARTPDVLLVDLCMPGMSVGTFLEDARSRSLARTPVALMTALAPSLIPPELAVNAILPKPFDIEDLLRTIERLVPPGDGGVAADLPR